ncbi:NOTCH1 [Mytilus coruscus]|uniref:NOTCH1 n=1 Tax=Mytilus coruscus TaxID=42192 RepID=A0A6J8EA68_MYTCO|nr:NOTCH1 [Mytilus coruscus]
MEYKPTWGTVMFTEVKTTVPDMYDCETDANVASEPCGNFSYTLPHDKVTMSWIYTTLTYKQSINVTGNDFLKIYVSDSMNASSSVVTIQFVIMESSCQNDGSCQPKNGSNYPCTSTYRAEHFDKYFECVCLPGWIGIYCEENIDECISSPCVESFECIDGVNKYECRCPVDDPNCDFKIWIIPLIVLSVVCIVTIIVVVICRYMYRKKREKNKKVYRDLLTQSSKDLLGDAQSRNLSFAEDTVEKYIDSNPEAATLDAEQVDFQENHDDLSNLDPVGFLNPAIGKSANPRWKNKVYPESLCTKKFITSPAEQKSESKLKEEFQEKEDLKYDWTYALPMHQVLEQALKPVSKPKIQFLREIKFKLSADEKNTEILSNPTEEREHDAETNLLQSMQPPLKQMYQTKMAKAVPATGLVAHSMSHSRENEQKQQEKSSDA